MGAAAPCWTNGGLVAAGQVHVASIHAPSNVDAPCGGGWAASSCATDTLTRTSYRSVPLLPTHAPAMEPSSCTRTVLASNLPLPSISVDALLNVASSATHCESESEGGWTSGGRGGQRSLLRKALDGGDSRAGLPARVLVRSPS